MLFKDVINLISISTTTNAIGDSVETATKKEVFANKKSVRQNEFYQAAATGLRPELMFVIHSAEYNQEPKVEYDGKTYNIIRTYDKGEWTELICSDIVNGVM